jgi:hypothetical protein
MICRTSSPGRVLKYSKVVFSLFVASIWYHPPACFS